MQFVLISAFYIKWCYLLVPVSPYLGAGLAVPLVVFWIKALRGKYGI